MTAISGANVSRPNQSAARNASACDDRLGDAARKDVVPHDFHAARHRGVDAIQRDDRHRAKHDRKRGYHFRIETQAATEETDERD